MKKENIALIFFGILVFFVCFEIILHVFEPLQGTPICAYGEDPELNYVLKPGLLTRHTTLEYDYTIAINSMGLRDLEISPSPDTPSTILIVGDSTTFGQGLDLNETYPKQLEKKLVDNGFPIQVINAGVPGYDTRQEVKLFKRISQTIHPKIGILGLFVGNDIVQNLNPLQFTVNPKNCLVPVQIGQKFNLKTFMYENFLSIRFFRENLRKVGFIRDILNSTHLFSKGEKSLNIRLYLTNSDKKDLNQAFDATEKEISDFAQFSRDNNIQPFLLILPASPQVYEALDATDIYDIPPDTIDFQQPQKILTKFANENGIFVIDVLPDLQAAKNQVLFYKKDDHETRANNLIVAKAIFDKINANMPKTA